MALPPFLVEAVAKGPPWRFAESKGYEILSRCDDRTTARVVEAHFQLHVLLAEILPPSLRLSFSLPRTLILYDEELQPAASQEVIREMLRTTPAPPETDYPVLPGGRGLRVAPPARRYSFLPNLRLWDRDGMAVFMIVRRGEFDPDRLALTHDYVSFLVKGRLPSLPPWFVSGFLTLYQQTTYDGGQLEMAPLEWIAEAFTSAVKKDPKTAPPLLPLADFLAGRLAPRDPAALIEPVRYWQAQAALLVRWGLDPRAGDRRAAFWQFTERVAVEGVSEKLFQECLGLDYAAAADQLAAYLPVAVRRTAVFRPGRPERLPPLPLRDASEGEIARLKGDWERLQVPYVRAIFPTLAPKYLEQARRTLRRAYDRDVRDPRLLAVMGLCESDSDNAEGARELLEAAAALGPLRPRANYELARLRLAGYRAGSAGDGGRLSVEQMVAILTPLFAARAQKPPLPEVYELIAEVWKHGAQPPNRGHLGVVEEGVRLFPRRASLVLGAAELYLAQGLRAEAEPLAALLAAIARDEPVLLERLARLRQGLAAP